MPEQSGAPGLARQVTLGQSGAPSYAFVASSLNIGHYTLTAEVLPSTWIIDLGASHHMHNGNDFDFNTYEHLPNPIRIQLGNKTCIFATPHGSVRVQDHQIDALHTPSFCYSLLSVTELDSQGYHTKFGNGKCSTQDSNVTVMTGSRNGQIFQVELINSRYSDRNPFAFLTRSNPLAFQSDRSNSFVLLSTAKSHLWHKHLAHLNHVSMKSLVDGYVPTDICEVCIPAKHERKIIRVPVFDFFLF